MKSFGSLVSSKPPCSCPRRMTAICFNNVPVHASFPKTNRLHQYTHVLCAITPGPSRLIIISRNDSIDLFRFPADYQSRFRGAVHKSEPQKTRTSYTEIRPSFSHPAGHFHSGRLSELGRSILRT